MKMKLVWTPLAHQNLIDIYVTIGREQPLAAERYFNRIEKKTELLLSHPRIGVRRKDVSPSFRLLVEKPFLIFYETYPDADHGSIEKVKIVRVIDGRQNLIKLL